MEKQKIIKDLPDGPGVYLFLKGKKILYIGKATSLKDRVQSYFVKDISFVRSLLIETMVEEATKIDFVETDSVLEALILEANLIKKHQPKYNTKEKDDKSFNFVVISKEDYPRVFTMRGHELQKLQTIDYKLLTIYGPYPAGGSLKEALKIIRKIFPFRGEKTPQSKLNEQLGLSPKEDIGRKEYAGVVNNIRLFFEGKKGKVIKSLEKQMKVFAKEHQFERAGKVKRQIFALNHINDIALIKEGLKGGDNYRIESYDIAHTSNQNTVGVMTVVQNGEVRKSQYRKFKIKGEKKGDTDSLREVLERRFGHTEWPLPRLLVVDGGKAQKAVVERLLDKYGLFIPVVAVVKGVGHKAQRILGKKALVSAHEAEILLANSEAHRFAISYHRELRAKLLGRPSML